MEVGSSGCGKISPFGYGVPGEGEVEAGPGDKMSEVVGMGEGQGNCEELGMECRSSSQF